MATTITKPDDFPIPPHGYFGWPWENMHTSEQDQSCSTDSERAFLPTISVVTPNYNGAKYLEQTIRSVLLQGYPKLEYVVIDGASTDESVSIIKRYEKSFSWWVSEKNDGQAAAINKGWRKVRGDVVCYLNSDDLLTPNALHTVARYFRDENVQWLCGACEFIGQKAKIITVDLPPIRRWLLSNTKWGSYSFPQPSVFMRRSLLQATGDIAGDLDSTLKYCFDFELFCRIRLSGIEPLIVPEVLSQFRLHSQSKTCAIGHHFFDEGISVARRLSHYLGFFEGFRVRWLIRLTYDEQSFFSSVVQPGLIGLCWGFVRFPTLIFSRLYWGRLKRIFFGVTEP